MSPVSLSIFTCHLSPCHLSDAPVARRHPGVLDVAVVGVPDERMGESPRAYVIRRNTQVEEQSIVDYVAERVAPHKRLEQVGRGHATGTLPHCLLPCHPTTLPPYFIATLPPCLIASCLAILPPCRQGCMFVESLPKNQTGKLLRRELKAQVPHHGPSFHPQSSSSSAPASPYVPGVQGFLRILNLLLKNLNDQSCVP